MNARRTAAPLAVIDIGTNSLKLLVGSSDGTRVRTRHFARVTTRLGEGLDASGRISEAAVVRTARAVRRLSTQARRHGAGQVTGVATYALRTARNGRAVARRITRETGVEVRVLGGREEARLAYLSACSRLTRRYPAALMLDVGGGSAQLVAVRGSVVVGSHSLPLGALSLTERHLHEDPIRNGEYRSMEDEVARRIRPLLAKYAFLTPRAAFIVVGGSATTAFAMSRGGRVGGWGGGVLTLAELCALERECLARTIAERKRIPGLPGDRADIMPAGIAVMLQCMRAAHKRVAHVTGGGVREGVILTIAARARGSARSRG